MVQSFVCGPVKDLILKPSVFTKRTYHEYTPMDNTLIIKYVYLYTQTFPVT